MRSKFYPMILTLAAILTFSNCSEFSEKQTKIYIHAGDFTVSVSEPTRVKAIKLPQAIEVRRGDSLLLIPITADALTQTAGESLRKDFAPKDEMETIYDQDLKRLKEELQDEMPDFIAKNMRKNYQKSDILGTAKVIAEEIKIQRQKKPNRLISVSFLSDMVHDTKEISFLTDKRLANAAEAKKLAAELARENGQIWKGVEIYIGILKSSDLQKLDEERRRAIEEFWLEYFRLGGCENPVFATDGIGQFQSFVEKEA